MIKLTVRVIGVLGPDWSDWFGGLQVRAADCGKTEISGQLEDYAAVYGVIERLRDLGMRMVEVRVEPLGCDAQKRR